MQPSQRRAIARALEDERGRAQARVRSLTREVEDIIERSSDAARDDEHDPEGSTVAFERAQVTALLAAARRQLVDIETATQRLAAGVHDRCEACGGLIAVERHQARPTARTCVSCAG